MLPALSGLSGPRTASGDAHSCCIRRSVQEGDLLWFVGSIDTIYFVSKISGLERAQAGQVAKLGTDILDRQLVQVRAVVGV